MRNIENIFKAKKKKKCVNAELVTKLQKEGNFILYGQKQSLKYVLGKELSGNFKTIVHCLKSR